MRPLPPFGSASQILLVLMGALLSLSLLARAQEEPLPPPPPLTGAIYFDPWQLEKEFVVSPLTLQQWVDLGLSPTSKLDAAQREALKPMIGEFLAQRCPVTINGEPVDFTLDRVEFIEPDQSEFLPIEPDAIVSPADVRVSVVFAAPNPDLQSRLQVIWDLFPDGESSVPFKTADIAGTRVTRLAQVAPSISVLGRYEVGSRQIPKAPPAPVAATLVIPWLSILLILGAVPVLIRIVRTDKPGVVALVILLALAGGAAAARKIATFSMPDPFREETAVDAEQSALILKALLRGVYHAFDYRDRDARYEALGEVVTGDAMTTIFLEIQRTLESRQRDGARVRVNDLDIEEAIPTPLPDRRGFEAECSWVVRGRVGHWGHFHDRTNLYRATFVVEPFEESWKITALTLLARDRDADPAP